MTATGWQAHSVRGFISGTLRKKLALTITSAKNGAGEHTYRITAMSYRFIGLGHTFLGESIPAIAKATA